MAAHLRMDPTHQRKRILRMRGTRREEEDCRRRRDHA
jgi:hypothetical protein